MPCAGQIQPADRFRWLDDESREWPSTAWNKQVGSARPAWAEVPGTGPATHRLADGNAPAAGLECREGNGLMCSVDIQVHIIFLDPEMPHSRAGTFSGTECKADGLEGHEPMLAHQSTARCAPWATVRRNGGGQLIGRPGQDENRVWTERI